MIRKFDFLIIGGGVAGMSYALKVANSGKGKVALVCKTTLDEANTAKAQGGVDFISFGALTHSVKGLDMSFKAAGSDKLKI